MGKPELMSEETADALLALIEKHEAKMAAAKPDDIPEAIWDQALRLFGISQGRTVPATISIARAIMAATTGWQSMGTAPTDGTKVIVWEDGEMHIAWSNSGAWVCQGDDYNLVVCPSRWMPAPVPPR